MANHFIPILVALNLFFILSTNGRVFQKNNSSSVSISDIKGKTVSLQAGGQTNAGDVQGLVALVTRFPTLKESNPDPCVSPRWTWIECNSDARPRIIALNLSRKRLIGSVPVFSSMTALQRIDLSQNYFSGFIPSFLGTFLNLQELNVADNSYYGYIPDSIACNKNLRLWVAGNAGLYVSSRCMNTGNIVDATLTPTTTYSYTPPTTYSYTPTTTYSYTPRTYSSNNVDIVRVILGSIGSLLFFISLVVGIYVCCVKNRQDADVAAPTVNAGTRPSDQITSVRGQDMPADSRPTMSPGIPR